jgi:hypothetical protein
VLTIVNKEDAKTISQAGITYGQVKGMLKRAYDAGVANDDISTINPSLSRATGFNIFWKAYSVHDDADIVRGMNELGVASALREFGEYWDGYRPDPRPKMRATGEFHTETAINIYQ